MKSISHWPEAGKHLIMLALAWSAFSIMFGLFQAFDVMESQENIASQAMMGALKTAGLLVLAGLIVFSIPILVFTFIRRVK